MVFSIINPKFDIIRTIDPRLELGPYQVDTLRVREEGSRGEFANLLHDPGCSQEDGAKSNEWTGEYMLNL